MEILLVFTFKLSSLHFMPTKKLLRSFKNCLWQLLQLFLAFHSSIEFTAISEMIGDSELMTNDERLNLARYVFGCTAFCPNSSLPGDDSDPHYLSGHYLTSPRGSEVLLDRSHLFLFLSHSLP